MHTVHIFLLLVSLVLADEEAGEVPEVTSSAGRFRGQFLTSFSGQRFAAFRGIPYALPPVGDRRFALPEEHPRIEGVFDASSFGSVCVQHIDGVSIGNEDCLYLNVFTPVHSQEPHGRGPLRKVLVFIHGGGFVLGSANPFIPGDLVVQGDLIVVTINYRLGWLGFLRGKTLPGNQAFWDQVLALRWVQSNIQAFGGDPGDVTLSGESAGAISVSLLSISPAATHLFTKAIVLSGVGFTFPSPSITSTDLIEAVRHQVGCSDADDVISCLRQQPASKFQTEFSFPLITQFPSSGDSLLPRPIPELLQDVSYLRDVGFLNKNYIVSVLGEDGFVRLRSRFGEMDTSTFESSAQDLSKLLQLPGYVAESLLIEYISTYEQLEQTVIAICTDFFYLRRSLHFLDIFSQAGPGPESRAYFMSFDPEPEFFPNLYAVHGLELVYLFDLHPKEFLESFYFLEVNGDLSDEDLQLKVMFIDLVASFVKAGDPNKYLSREQHLVWPPYDSSNQSYLSVNLHPILGQDLLGDRRVIWEHLVPRWRAEYESLLQKDEL